MANGAYKRASSILQKAKGPKWKRELVSDHKFDFMDTDSFRERTCLLTIRYLMLLCSVVVSTLVYSADLWSAGILLIYDHWSLSIQPKIPFEISKWIFVGCIILSFMLLAWEIRKTRSVMETRDISLAVTNPLAYRTYSLKDYSYFCLLQKIKNSTKWSDVIIFYVFYTLKGWKKIIIAQGPRQIIAGFTVYAILSSALIVDGKFQFSTDWDKYGKDWPQRLALFSMSFTCILWILATLQIFLAVLLYFPVLCQIQGNLKEYCCHKIDKRIDELLEKQRKKRLREREKYANSINSKKSKKSTRKDRSKFDDIDEAVPTLPTLPVINTNSNAYAGDKKDAQWMYQQPLQQNSFHNHYYDSQPMTPLESTYSLQRNPTKYSPYNESYYISNQNVVSNMYSQQDSTKDYYYGQSTQQQQYSSNVTSPPLTNNFYTAGTTVNSNIVSKPNTYDDELDSRPKQTDSNYNTATVKYQSQLSSNSNGNIKSGSSHEDFTNNQPNLQFDSSWKQDVGTNRRQEVNDMRDDSAFAYYSDTNAVNAPIPLQDQQHYTYDYNTKNKEQQSYTHYI
ncbi:hypothetical protein BD770DRAFT_343934 [Pilaira anomala]|nr:hypothetical protein BD770DRAFT_343934 [Pilaira anomala]